MIPLVATISSYAHPLSRCVTLKVSRTPSHVEIVLDYKGLKFKLFLPGVAYLWRRKESMLLWLLKGVNAKSQASRPLCDARKIGGDWIFGISARGRLQFVARIEMRHPETDVPTPSPSLRSNFCACCSDTP